MSRARSHAESTCGGRALPTPLVLPALVALAALAGLASPAPRALAAKQTQPWRIGVGGDLPTGYLGALAIYGLPHEAILDQEMTSAADLARFQIVILSQPDTNPAGIDKAVEEYVRRGGCVIYEEPCLPSAAMIPGRRIGLQRGPKILYSRNTAITDDLTDQPLTIDRDGKGLGESIIPSGPGVDVLARFTNHLAEAKYRGRFLDGDRGAPAILLASYGKGEVAWAGVHLSMMAAFDDYRTIAPFVVNLVRALSRGQVTPRFVTRTASTDTLVTQPHFYHSNPARLVPGEAAAKPAKAEVIEEDPGAAGEYDLYGGVKRGAEATAYTAYYNARWYRAVVFGKDSVSIVRCDAGKPTVLRSVPLPAGKGPLDVLIKRRWSGITVYADGAPLISACEGRPLRGVVAAAGMDDPAYQPVAPVDFTDDFMRTAKEKGVWQTVSGKWQMVQSEGQPSMGANPFRYQGIAQGTGIATAGFWFWDDYSVEMSVFPDGAACGVIGHYQDPKHYTLVRLATPKGGRSTVSIVEHTPKGDAKLASAPVNCDRQRWYKLGLRATSGTIVAVLDGKAVASAPDRWLGNGAVGLYVEGGRAQFDDVAVTPWHGTRHPASGWGPWEWDEDCGDWTYYDGGGAGGALSAAAAKEGRALTADDDYADGSFAAEVRPRPGSELGLMIRYEDKGDFVMAGLACDGSGKLSAVLDERHGGQDRTLGSAAVGGDPAAWHRLAVDGADHDFTVSVDGKPCLTAYAAAAELGAVGLFVRGGGAFRDWSFLPRPAGEDVNDTPTPVYAGIIDRNSWAGRAGAWRADPTDLTRFWHAGYFPHEVDLRLGVYRDVPRATTAKVLLAPEGAGGAGAGYVLTAKHDWGGSRVGLELTRAGKKVASGSGTVAGDADRYCLALRREGALLTASVGGRDCLAYEDASPIFAPRLGFQITGGGLVHPNDTRVASTDLRNYTFDAAPTDWYVQNGQWGLTSRWPCTPGWAWFSGVSTKYALVRTKAKFTGDQEVQFYAGAKDLPTGEAMRDIIVGLCGAEDPSKGYRFTIESHSGGTFLTKNGKIVARAKGFKLSQKAIHFDWTSFAAKKEGNKLSLEWWGRRILQYTDPSPLKDGYVWLGTYHNGISIPRVTVYGAEE